MTERCEWCNHKAPDHDPLCGRPKHLPPASKEFAKVPLVSHEEHQHRAAYGGGADPGAELASPPDSYRPLEAMSLEEIGDAMHYVAPRGLTDDYVERKQTPIGTGVLDYFPDALAEVAKASLAGNKQHKIETLRWDRSKSTDEADAMIRHFLQRGTVDSDGVLHSAKMAWRALALLQKEIEASRS